MSSSAAVLLNRVLAHCSLRHVQVLVMLAETGSVQRAAEAIGVASPTVAHALTQLDEVLETELFRHDGTALHPTAACLALLPHARQVMGGLAGAADALVAQRRSEGIVVRVLASSPGAASLLAQALPFFEARYARVHVQWREDDGQDPAGAIERGEVDLVVGRRPAAIPAGWAFHEVPTELFAAVCAPDHPLAARSQASWGELSRQAWLLPPAGSAARERFDALLEQAGKTSVSYCVVTSVDDMADWLMRDHDVLAFAPITALLHLLATGELVRLRPGNPPQGALGLLQPRCAGEAALRLSGFLQHFAATPGGTATSGLPGWNPPAWKTVRAAGHRPSERPP